MCVFACNAFCSFYVLFVYVFVLALLRFLFVCVVVVFVFFMCVLQVFVCVFHACLGLLVFLLCRVLLFVE